MKKKENLASKDLPLKVGNVKEYIPIVNKKTGRKTKSTVFYTYKDVTYDSDGWADVTKYLPEDYDLVYLRLKRERTIPGWIFEKTWYALRLLKDDVVLFWKRKKEERAYYE